MPHSNNFRQPPRPPPNEINLPPLEWDIQPVETEFALNRRLFKQFNPKKEYYFLPNGEIDTAREQEEDALIEKETIKIRKEQQKALDEAIQRILASHLDFN